MLENRKKKHSSERLVSHLWWSMNITQYQQNYEYKSVNKYMKNNNPIHMLLIHCLNVADILDWFLCCFLLKGQQCYNKIFFELYSKTFSNLDSPSIYLKRMNVPLPSQQQEPEKTFKKIYRSQILLESHFVYMSYNIKLIVFQFIIQTITKVSFSWSRRLLCASNQILY